MKKGEKREKGEMGTLSYLEEGSVYKINKFIRAYIIIKQKNYLNPYFPLFPFFPFFPPHHSFAILLRISKLNRTFDCVLGTPSWICKRKNSFLSCISQNLIVPLRTEDNCEYEDKHHHSRI